MDNKTRELVKLAVARLNDMKEAFADDIGENDYIVAETFEEQFAEDGAGGEALAILEGLLKDQ